MAVDDVTRLKASEAQPIHGLPSPHPPRQAVEVWRTRILRVWHTCFDLVFPPRCAACGRADVVWCERCQGELDAVPLSLHIADSTAEGVPLRVAATGRHEGMVQQAIHALKYHAVPALHQPLAGRLAAALTVLRWEVDLIAPVPMHAHRLAERGYNQAALLAETLALASGLPCDSNLLKRDRFTRSQVGLGMLERQANVAEAFSAGNQSAGRRVLLVDDVYTTGATLAACASALYAAGAAVVYGLTVSTATGVASHNHAAAPSYAQRD